MHFQCRHALIHSSGPCDPHFEHLVQPLWRAHSRLDRQAPHILPPLLQQTDQVIDSQHDIANQLILRHTHIPYGNTQTQHLLQLELDRALHLCHLHIQVLSVSDRGWEFAGFGKTGAKETRNLAHERVRGDEGIVFAGELLDQLLVLVEFLKIIGRHGVDAVVFGAVDVVLVSEDTVALLAFSCHGE
jgi:hypothetical protein